MSNVMIQKTRKTAWKMTAFICTLAVLLSACSLFSLIAITVSAEDSDSQADFTMTEPVYNVSGAALLAIDGCFTYDPEQYQRGAILIATNDMAEVPEEARGQMLLHGGRGDAYTFTMDFGDYKVNRFGFSSYGLAIDDTVVGVEIDGQLLGNTVARAGNGWADADPSVWHYNEIVFEEAYTGLHTVTIRILDSAPAWPANGMGNFMFLAADDAEEETKPENTVDFTMDSPRFNVSGAALLAIDGCFTYDPEQYQRGAILIATNDMAEVPEEGRGQILLHGGRGDAYTFTIDFGTYHVDRLGFSSFGLAPEDTVVGLEIDGKLIGSSIALAGNGWADADPSVWYYNEIVFDEAYTGLHTVTIRILESAPAWPANGMGNFLFLEQKAPEETTVPEKDPETQPEPDTDTEPVTDPETEPATQPTETESATVADTNVDDVTSESETNADTVANQGGCGSTVIGIAATMVLLSGMAMIVLKKRDE